MNKIVVLKGGNSPEREVSLKSGAAVADELRNQGYYVVEQDPADYPEVCELIEAIKTADADTVFNALHGGSGENGELAAAFDLAGVSYTGSRAKSSVLSMDKYVSKLIAEAEGVPVPDCILMRYDLIEDYKDPQDYAGFVDNIGLPMVVKPVDAGSSVGISLVKQIDELKKAVTDAFQYCPQILLEQYIPGRELTVSVLNGKALPLVEIVPLKGWYDYANKYTKGNTQYIAPAELDSQVSELIQVYAERIYKALGCRTYARIDFRFDGEKAWFLEVNTLPGMTSLSLTPMAAKAAGMSFGELLKSIIESQE